MRINIKILKNKFKLKNKKLIKFYKRVRKVVEKKCSPRTVPSLVTRKYRPTYWWMSNYFNLILKSDRNIYYIGEYNLSERIKISDENSVSTEIIKYNYIDGTTEKINIIYPRGQICPERVNSAYKYYNYYFSRKIFLEYINLIKNNLNNGEELEKISTQNIINNYIIYNNIFK